MEKLSLKKYINHPDALDKDSLNNLFELSREFPYFQTAWFLLAKNLHTIDDHRFDEIIKKAATYANDRSRLQQIIMTTTTTEKTIEKPKPKESEKTIEKPKKIKSEEKLQVEENKDEQIAPKPAEKETTSETLKETQQSKTDNDAPIAPAEDEKQSVKHESPKQETKDSKQENDLESLLKERLKELKKKRNELDEISIEIKKISEHQDEKTEADNEKTDKNKGYILSDEDLFNFPEKNSHTQKSTKTKTAFTIESLENNKKTNAKNQKQEIIDKFITERSKSKPSFSKTKKTIDFDIPKFHETSELVTETLAKIYTSQGHLDKALTTYEKLSLKYPQKNIYFANQIEKIKELIRTKEK